MPDNNWYVVADIRTADRQSLHDGVYGLSGKHAANWAGDTDGGGLVNVRFAPAATNPAMVKVEALAFLARALDVSVDDVDVCNLTRESDMRLFENP